MVSELGVLWLYVFFRVQDSLTRIPIIKHWNENPDE